MNSKKEEKKFSLIARLKSTAHAWRGLRIIIKTTHNMWVHLFVGFLAVVLGFVFQISNLEWTLVVIAICFVLVAESINTAIEIDIDLTSPEYHPFARDTKDVSAGAVLLSGIFACIIGAIVFLPKIWAVL